MPARSEYDRFAEIYQVWTDTAASTEANLPFYVDAYVNDPGPVVELGVGDGRIAVAAALRGQSVIGVDLSAAMLDRCRLRAERAGVLDRLTLRNADFRSFELDQPAGLIAVPAPSPCHLAPPAPNGPGRCAQAARPDGFRDRDQQGENKGKF